MEIAEAKAVLEALILSADPATGELLDGNNVINSPQVRNAFLVAARALEREERREERAHRLPGHAGQPWQDEEDVRLSQAFASGATLEELSVAHERTPGAIRSRLMKLGLLIAGDSVLPATAIPEVPKIPSAQDAATHAAQPEPALDAALARKTGYAIGVAGTHVFRGEELQVLHRYGFWLEALATRRIEPTTPAQERFCRVVRGECKPETVYERAWMRLTGRREIEPELTREFQVNDPGEEWFRREAHWRYR